MGTLLISGVLGAVSYDEDRDASYYAVRDVHYYGNPYYRNAIKQENNTPHMVPNEDFYDNPFLTPRNFYANEKRQYLRFQNPLRYGYYLHRPYYRKEYYYAAYTYPRPDSYDDSGEEENGNNVNDLEENSNEETVIDADTPGE